MSALAKEIAQAVMKAANNGHLNHCEARTIAAADAAIHPLVDALREALEWDGYDESEVPAVWLNKAEAVLARAGVQS